MIFFAIAMLLLLVVGFAVLKQQQRSLFNSRILEVQMQKRFPKTTGLENASKRLRTVFLDTHLFASESEANLQGNDSQQQTQPSPQQQNGEFPQPADLWANLSLKPQEAELGAEIEINFSHFKQCSNCQGTGCLQPSSMVQNLTMECSLCGAQGTKEELGRWKISVPAGVKARNRLRVQGAGNNGGNLYLFIAIDEA